MFDETTIKEAVRDRYAGAAARSDSCCGPAPEKATSGCAGGAPKQPETNGRSALGYAADDLEAVPDGADLGLGCGNPFGMLGLAEGETVLDLGSGAGVDCFIAAKRVGPTGHVIGVDMTPEMIAKARRNAARSNVANVDFRLGEIEHLPVEDSTVGAIISNCAINLVPDKRQVFADAFRVLRPGGRLSVSDIVLTRDVPAEIADSVEAYVSCLAGAVRKDEYLALIAAAGFEAVEVTSETSFGESEALSDDLVREFSASTGRSEADVREAASGFASARVAARKPVV